ncbi:MAG: glycoside hydrolase family 99-like domain-containing protein [Actinomycetota bacterium]|nr:glycoside hydrolase family 99-like domain-containing protein [Actinomycetota bacterium]
MISTSDAQKTGLDVFAYYLPQFHPISLNSTWWGEGFTEWNSTLRAVRGWRAIPGSVITPGELGFYDLRSFEVRQRQGELARLAKLSAFCVYHYYSCGEHLMPAAVEAMLSDGQPDVPFFFCWANHDWTLAWQNRPQDTIMKQRYDELANDNHIDWLLDAFADPRYYKIGSAPVIKIYDVAAIPHAGEVLAKWRNKARERGFSDLVILGRAPNDRYWSAGGCEVAAWVQDVLVPLRYMPAWQRVAGALRSPQTAVRLARFGDYPISRQLLKRANDRVFAGRSDFVPTVLTSFNNVGRRARRASFLLGDPEGFAADLTDATRRAPVVRSPDGARRLAGINAWNEWGESMAMEPSTESGRALLEACASVLGGLG